MGAISFQTVRGLKPKKNTFNKSHMVAFPTTMGKLVPVMTDFIIPGSKVKMSSSLHTRMQALISPIMDNVNTYVHCWNVPVRLVDDKFKKFIGNEIDPEEYNPAFFTPVGFFEQLNNLKIEYANDYDNGGSFSAEADSLPYGYLIQQDERFVNGFSSLVSSESLFNSSLLESLGYVGTSDWWEVSEQVLNLYEFKAYLLLLKTWYINENITIKMPFYSYVHSDVFDFVAAIDDFLELEGNVSRSFCAMYLDFVFNFGLKAHFNHGWAKDYFTSALPNTQYGEPVTLPLATSAPVVGNLQVDSKGYFFDPELVTNAQSSTDANLQLGNSIPGPSYRYDLKNEDGGDINAIQGRFQTNADVAENGSELHADLSEATAISIIELRIAETLQLFKERLMRAGRRYREYLRMFFNVVSSDATLQDPQWLGGGRVALNVSDIPQMSATNEVSPQGNLAGKAMQFGQNFSGFTFYAEEWCVVICLAYMQPKARYSLGIDRNKMKTNNIYDWFNPTFEHVGEQPLYTAELYAGDVPNGDVFGYQRRYAEYTFKNDRMFGAFGNTLSHWTAGLRLFGNKPVLNQQFIYVQPETFDRIFALAESQGEGNILMWFYHNYYVKQPVSKFGTPGLHI